MRFTKMQGAGNDYVYVDCFSQDVADPAALAPIISDRHFGVGGDGLILIMPSDAADVRMRMFNADGSEAQMCGNGIRCVAKYAWDHGLAASTSTSTKNPMYVETVAGVKTVELETDAGGKVTDATVDMGEPILAAASIPVDLPSERVVDMDVSAGGGQYRITCVSMGNPHAIIYVDDVSAVDLASAGLALETDAIFPERVNVHFVEVISPGEVTMRTWERGSGITLACGTGAAAVCVAGVLTGRCERSILAHLPGGDLRLQWRQDDNRVYMTGPAREVFTGEWPG